MNNDATEAALGLLGLSPLNAPQSHPQPQPHPHQHVAHAHGPSLTSSSVGIAVDRTSVPHIIQSALPPSLVPLKRKQPSPALATPLSPAISRDTKPQQPSHPLATSTPPASAVPSQRHPQQRPFSPVLTTSIPPQTPPTSQPPLASPSTSKRPLVLPDAPPPPDSDAISCICGFTYDDGFSIACDDCSRWCHAACFGIVQGEVPEFWKCWVCDPALVVDKERAVKIQRGRLKAVRVKASQGANGTAPGTPAINGVGGSVVDEGNGGVGKPASRRKTSPGAERKSRRGSAVAAAIEGSGTSKKKRRASMLSPADPSSPSIPTPNHSAQPHASSSRISQPNGNGSSLTLPPTPVTFPPDIYPNPSIYAQLLRVAKAWRGVTALNPPPSPLQPPPKTYNDGGYMRVDSQGYQDRYGYSMSPLDNTTPVMLDENVGDTYVPRTVLRMDPSLSYPHPSPSTTCTPAHLRPPSPKLHVASDPLPFSHTSIYPSPPISNFMSPVPSSSQARPYVKSPLSPSTNIISSSNPNNTVPATTLLAPYTTTIVPSSAYLADPLNGYAHLGMGKPQVRLVGGGWGVGLDARGMGGVPDAPDLDEKANGVNASREDVVDGKARWARCGCWPNAVVRPVICSGTRRGNKGIRMRHKGDCTSAAPEGSSVPKDGGPPQAVNDRCVPPPVLRMQEQQTDDSSDQDDAPSVSDSDADPTSLSFALFALRDLRADEEIVLGWEWDDGHAVHMLPALMESPGIFAPAHLHHLRAQFTSILHALSSTFTTCACGSSTRDCAVRVMENVVEGRWPWPGGDITSEGSGDESSDGASGGWDEGDVDVEGDGHLDPHPAPQWGLGMNVDVDIEMDTSLQVNRPGRRIKKRKVRKKNKAVPVDGKNANAVASSSTLKPKTKKAIDLGPLVGVEREFRTREKVPMNGGWGGVEIIPSNSRSFPQVRVEEDPPVDGKGKGKARVVDDEDNMDIDPSSSTLPPRMRKGWSRSSTVQPESVQENPPGHSKRAESWRAHERWRSPPEIIAESPISVSGIAGGSGESGTTIPSGSSGDHVEDGQETEFDTETETDGLDDARQMPPPPMPASLDPTTISSLAHAHAARSSSPRGTIHRDKSNVASTCIPSRTPTPTSTSLGQGMTTPIPSVSSPTSLQPNPPQPLFTSLPMPVQAQSQLSTPLQFHPPSLVSSVSPSAPFSKLSLHSPDTSSSQHSSMLFSSSESTPPSIASTLTQCAPDLRAPSPPSHRPSKPLHVHPQNEPPSLPLSLSAPVVTPSSSDGLRDTPAEAQYQQSYRPSPEARQETSDVDKKHPSDGEVHRVRFASPEILYGSSQLRRTTPEPIDIDGGVSADSRAPGSLVPSSDQDAMDVDADAGDNQKDSSETPENGANHNPGNESVSPRVPSSPHLQPPSDSLVRSVPALADDVAPENPALSPTADEKGRPSQAEPMSVDPEPIQPAREPSPPPPPKVKMSLKDFALRKKKQREEEMAAKALCSPASPDDPVLPPSPSLETSQDLMNEHAPDPGNGHGVKVNCTIKEEASSSGIAHGVTRDSEAKSRDGEKESSSERRAPTVTTVTKSPPRPPRSPTTLRVLGERNSTDPTRMQLDSKPLTTLTAKMEVIDAVLPSGLVGPDDCTPDAASFAPEPPPPPLTTKQTNKIMTTDRNGPTSSEFRSIAPSTPASTSTSTTTSAANSRSNSVGILAPNPNTPSYLHASNSSSSIPPSRRPSHEDGEITSSTPPKTYLPRSHTPPTQPRSFHAVHPPSPSFGPTSSSTIPTPRRAAPPLSRSPLSNAAGPTPAPTSSRPLPSGPRALRGSMTQPTHAPPYSSPRPPYAGSQYIPRGPSADRDRIDWDRDRSWSAQARTRGRAGSNGWGR